MDKHAKFRLNIWLTIVITTEENHCDMMLPIPDPIVCPESNRELKKKEDRSPVFSFRKIRLYKVPLDFFLLWKKEKEKEKKFYYLSHILKSISLVFTLKSSFWYQRDRSILLQIWNILGLISG